MGSLPEMPSDQEARPIDLGEPSVVVYSVLADFNGPLPKPVRLPGVSFVCFYRGEFSEEPGWEFRPLPDLPELEGPRISRLPKAVPHVFIPEFNSSIYIVSSVELSSKGIHELRKILRTHSVALIPLRSRANLREEFDLVGRKRFDSLYSLTEQVNQYTRIDKKTLSETVFWGGLIARRHHDTSVQEFGFRWMVNILRFSRRDQLSLPLALRSVPVTQIFLLEGNEDLSPFHRRLKGVAKSVDYIIGPRISTLFPASFSDREGFYVAEIASLRSLLRWRELLGRLITALSRRR